MTKSKVVFDPFSEEFFNGAWDTYRRMQEEAPVYYSEEYDFYALTRHEDVAAAFKDFETYSSACGIDLAMVRTGQKPPQQSIIFMDPPDHRHMRSLLNKVFTPRAIQSQREMVIEKIDKYLGAADPDDFDVVQDFSGPFPVEVITTMSGVPEEHAPAGAALDRRVACTASPGRSRSAKRACRPTSTPRCIYYGLVQERRDEPRDDMISQADRRRDRTRRRRR